MRRGLALAVILVAACGAGEVRVIVAAGTTLVDSGLIDALVQEYEDAHPDVELSVVGDATAQVLALARSGAVDVTITHAPDLEAAFEAEGRAALAETVFASRFILIGPERSVGGLAGKTLSEALAEIAAVETVFVSRADGSGTHMVEQAGWSAIGLDPAGEEWYLETGQGMGLTMQVASERQGMTLAELGAYQAAEEVLDLVDAGLARQGLDNPYRAMAVAGSPVEQEAVAFVEWLASPSGRRALAAIDARLFPLPVYTAVGG